MKSTRISAVIVLFCILAVVAACHHKRNKANLDTKLVSVATLYEKGQAAMKDHKEMKARRYFDQIVLREDAGEYKDKASIAIADSYIEEHTIDAYAEAISRYRAFLAFHPTHPRAAYCQYMIGHAYFKEINTPDRDTTPATQARLSLKALLENYPSSSYVKDAKKELRQIDDVLAAHEIKVGDWYLKSGHPKGAVARYRYALAKYPHYWNVPLLQYRLAEALRENGQTSEAALYYKAIDKSVPGTKLAKKAEGRMNDIDKNGKVQRRKKEKELKGPLVRRDKSAEKHWWQFWKWFR